MPLNSPPDPTEHTPDGMHPPPPPAPVPVFLVTDEVRRREEPPLPDAPDGPFWEIEQEDEPANNTPSGVAPADAAPPVISSSPSVAPASMAVWRNVVIGLALLIWLAVAFKAWQLRNRPAPVATAPGASQLRVAPRATEAPSRPIVRRVAPVKRRVANNRRIKRASRRAAEPKRSIILGRGAVAEDDKSIIRIRD